MEPARLLRYVTPLLLSDNEEAVVEAARAFGNFSRTAEARQYLVSARVLEALVLLLDHSSAEVLYRRVMLSFVVNTVACSLCSTGSSGS
jgi:hypothetical protein